MSVPCKYYFQILVGFHQIDENYCKINTSNWPASLHLRLRELARWTENPL